ncbi:MAG: Hsp33 family molecular chaperone HslO, partial [Clostridiales bacterium]|nr:Hsp33 family molecular chaperone HslO [Clostridiales bacterium]
MQKKVSAIHKTLIWGGEVSLAVLDTTALVNEAISRHHLSPVASAALGRTLTASAYLC